MNASKLQLSAFLVSAIGMWGSLYLYVPAFAVFAEEQGASLAMVGLIWSAYGVVQGVLRVPTGYFSDRFGRRLPFLVIGVGMTALGSLLMALSPHPAVLMLGRGLHGFGAAAFVVQSVYFASFFPPEKVTRALLGISSLIALTQLAVSLLGGQMALHWGQSSTFWGSAALGAISVAAIMVAGEQHVARRIEFDWSRFRAVLADPTLLLVSATAALLVFGEFGITQTTMLLLADRLGADSAYLGLLTAINYLAIGSAGLLLATLGTYPERWVVIAGLVISGVALLLMPLAGGLAGLTVLAFVKGAMRGSMMPSLMGLGLKVVAPDARASAMGLFQAIYAIGMFAGPVSTGIISQVAGLEAPFYAIGAFTVLSAGLVLVLFGRWQAG